MNTGEPPVPDITWDMLDAYRNALLFSRLGDGPLPPHHPPRTAGGDVDDEAETTSRDGKGGTGDGGLGEQLTREDGDRA